LGRLTATGTPTRRKGVILAVLAAYMTRAVGGFTACYDVHKLVWFEMRDGSSRAPRSDGERV
jgi:hypothetical protein